MRRSWALVCLVLWVSPLVRTQDDIDDLNGPLPVSSLEIIAESKATADTPVTTLVVEKKDLDATSQDNPENSLVHSSTDKTDSLSPSTVKPDIPSTVLPDITSSTSETSDTPSSTTVQPDTPSSTTVQPDTPSSTTVQPDTPSTSTVTPDTTVSSTEQDVASTTTEQPTTTESPVTSAIDKSTEDSATTVSTTVSEPGSTSSVQPDISEESKVRKEKQLKFDENDLTGGGPKVCNCQDGVVERKDPSSCQAGRVTSDPDCPCREVCAKQTGQSCGTEQSVCDAEFGLRCNEETKTCLGKLFVQPADITHSSVTLRWRTLSKFTEIPQASAQYTAEFSGPRTKWSEQEVTVKESTAKFENLSPNTDYFFKIEENGIYEILPLKTKDGCKSNNSTESPTWVGLGENFHLPGCERTCTCREGGQSECHERCQFRPGSLKDPLCEEVPDPDDACCVMYKCLDHEPSDNAKVLITQKTPSSLTLAWDDFKLPNYESGYVVEYRALDDQKSQWEQVQAGNIPLMTITKLTPHTAYQIRVMVWEDPEVKKRGSSSEVVTVYTEDGCVRNNQTLVVGAEFFEGCDLACTCKGKDEGQCRDRCNPPYYRAGTLGKDPLCSETPLDSDPCCVTVRCSQDNLGPREGVTFAEKIGSCPEVIHVTSADNSTDDKCPKECAHDHECGPEGPSFKCCPNYCGGMTCTDVAPQKDVCETVFCGKNAKCGVEESLPKCECLEGFNGDPNSLDGCQKIVKSTLEKAMKSSVCTYGNATHDRGENFFVGCELRCTCGDDLEVSCSPRCAFAASQTSLYKDTNATEVASRDPLCDLVPDPLDSCCKILACETTEELSTIIPIPGSDTVAVNETESAETTTRNASTQRSLQMDDTTTVVTEPSSESPTTVLVISNEGEETVTEQPETTTMANLSVPIFVETVPKSVSTEEAVYATEMATEATESDGRSNETLEVVTETILVPETTPSLMVVPETRMTGDEETTTMVVDVIGTESAPKNESVNDLLVLSGEEVDDSEIPKKGPIRLDGCEYNNQTYGTGETFDDGCEARCTCEGPGRVSCKPRCPLSTSDDNTVCHEVVDPNDSCCKIMICERPGDEDAVRNAEELKLIIDSVEPQNATTVRLRLTLGGGESADDSAINNNNVIQVWYAPSKEGSTDNDATWKKISVKLGDMQRLSPNVIQVDVPGLDPETEYFFKVRKHVNSVSDVPEKSFYSNTVNVKTFSKAVQSVFKGCFHKNSTYEVGKVFYDGCKYKCVCQEKGLIQCQERCEQYLDTVGYEHCRWAPAPDDPCCTIPYCDGDSNRDTDHRSPPEDVRPRVPLIPTKDAYCLSDEGFRHALGDTWELGEGCTRKVCTCAMRSNGTTVIECNGGCSPIPASVQHPTPDCPHPILVTPDDPCLCPYILCNNAVNPLSVPTPMCDFKGRRFHVAEEFYDGCRAVCQCGRDLRVNCAVVECPHHFPAHVSECLEWEVDPDFVPTPPKCCPPAKCKNDGSCRFNGMTLSNYQPVPQELLDCGTRCVCVNGNVTCEQRCPQLTQTPPPNLNCPPSMAYKGRVPGDPCCQHWICRPPVSTAAPNNPPTVGRHDMSNVALGNEKGKGLENVSVVALNSTAIRLRFSLPSLLVGLAGHAELRFTTDPNVPRDAWHVQKFARPQRLFDTANIEYHLAGLRPATTYFFRVSLVIDALHSGPESEVFKLKMPAAASSDLSTSESSTLTSSSTTLPPMILVDAMLTSQAVQEENAVKVSWRPFEAEEKKFIDGVRLKYKRHSDPSAWKFTPMIHRDVTSYVIRDLEPGASYQVEMELATPDHLTTHLVSTKMLEVKTPSVPKTMDVNISLKTTNVGSFSTDLSVQGVPMPFENHVNVAKVTFKSDADADETRVFKSITADGKIPLDHLKPGRRYKVWVDLYLTNGKTVSSNVLEVMTKAAPPGVKSSQDETNANLAEALQGREGGNDDESKSYYIALIVVAVIAAVAALGFVILLVILLRRQSSAKAPITRSPSEAAYDNPTYKDFSPQTYDATERHTAADHVEKNGNGVQPC